MSEFYVQEERFPLANHTLATGCFHLSRASGPHPLEFLHFSGGGPSKSLRQWHQGPQAALARALCRAGLGSFQAVTHDRAPEAELVLAAFRVATRDPRVSRLRVGLSFFGDPPADLPRVMPSLRTHRDPRGVVLIAPRTEIPWSAFSGLRVCVLSNDPPAAATQSAQEAHVDLTWIASPEPLTPLVQNLAAGVRMPSSEFSDLYIRAVLGHMEPHWDRPAALPPSTALPRTVQSEPNL